MINNGQSFRKETLSYINLKRRNTYNETQVQVRNSYLIDRKKIQHYNLYVTYETKKIQGERLTIRFYAEIKVQLQRMLIDRRMKNRYNKKSL